VVKPSQLGHGAGRDGHDPCEILGRGTQDITVAGHGFDHDTSSVNGADLVVGGDVLVVFILDGELLKFAEDGVLMDVLVVIVGELLIVALGEGRLDDGVADEGVGSVKVAESLENGV